MKFLADMGISPATADFLRGMGHDATHLREEGLERSSDAAILEKARTENRVLLTHDLDFGELIAASGAMLPSVIIFRLRNMRPTNVNHHIQAIIVQHNATLDQGAIVSVIEGRIRVRLLPISGEER